MKKSAQEAYIRGFCKFAESRGVNPEALYKYAKNQAISNGIKWVSDPLKRYWQLLMGGNNKVEGLSGYRKIVERLEKLNARALKAKDSATMGAITQLQNELSAAAHGGEPLAKDWFKRLGKIKGSQSVLRGVSKPGRSPFVTYRLKGRPGTNVGISDAVTNELGSVDLARIGTAAGVGGAGVGAYALSGNDEPRPVRYGGYYGG